LLYLLGGAARVLCLSIVKELILGAGQSTSATANGSNRIGRSFARGISFPTPEFSLTQRARKPAAEASSSVVIQPRFA